MKNDERRLAVAACRTIHDGDFVCMSWEFTKNIPEELRGFFDHYFQEWMSRDCFTTVQGMIEEQFNISQEEIDDDTKAD